MWRPAGWESGVSASRKGFPNTASLVAANVAAAMIPRDRRPRSKGRRGRVGDVAIGRTNRLSFP